MIVLVESSELFFWDPFALGTNISMDPPSFGAGRLALFRKRDSANQGRSPCGEALLLELWD